MYSDKTGMARIIAEHIDKDDAYLLDRLGSVKKGLATTFTSTSIAQRAIDDAIASKATDAAFKKFMRNAVPGTTFKFTYPPRGTPANGRVLGSGYEKLQNGSIVKLTDLKRVRITLAIGPDGKLFISTAFPEL